MLAGALVHPSSRTSMATEELDWLRQRVRELESAAADAALAAPSARRQLGGNSAFSTTVFTMGTEVSLVIMPTVMLIIIVLTVAIEKLVHLSHHVPEAYHPLVQKLEEEFMIMGAVSFLLVIVEFSAGISHDLLLNIEFAHLLLFFAAISLVSFALRTLVSTNECQKHWDRLERSDRLKAYEAFDTQSKEPQHAAHMFGRFLWSILYPFGEFDAKDSAEHLVMRRVFCEQFDLQGEVEQDGEVRAPFDFAYYLRLSLMEVVSSLLDINLLHWASLAAIVRAAAAPHPRDDLNPACDARARARAIVMRMSTRAPAAPRHAL